MIQIICLDVNDNIFAFDLLRNANILLDDLTLYICERFWSYLRFRCSDLNSEKAQETTLNMRSIAGSCVPLALVV